MLGAVDPCTPKTSHDFAVRNGTIRVLVDQGTRERQRPAKCPLFDPVCPLFEHDRLHHGLTARMADRAVLVELRRFLAGIHAILGTPDKREVGSSNLPRPIGPARREGTGGAASPDPPPSVHLRASILVSRPLHDRIRSSAVTSVCPPSAVAMISRSAGSA